MENKSEIIIITGEIGQGKTSFVINILKELRKENLNIGGILSVGRNIKGKKEGFDIVNIRTGENMTLCNTTSHKNWLQFGRYYFDPDTFRTGNEWLKGCADNTPDLIIIDEIGPLELLGKGWSPAIKFLLRNVKIPQIWVIRKNLVERVLSEWNFPNSKIFDIKSVNFDSVLKIVKEIIADNN